MIEDIVAKLGVREVFMYLLYVFPYFGYIYWPKILKEALVGEVLNVWMGTLSMSKKKAFGMSLGGCTSAR